MQHEHYELGEDDQLTVIVNVTGEADLSRVKIELGRRYSWESDELDTLRPGEYGAEETTTWLKLKGCANLTVAQTETETETEEAAAA